MITAYRQVLDVLDSTEMCHAMGECIDELNAAALPQRIAAGSIWLTVMRVHGRVYLVVEGDLEPVW